MDRSIRFLFLVVFMIFYVVGGTLLHESGHILIASLLGYHSVLHYASMNWYLPDGTEGMNKTHSFYIDLGGVLLLDAISLVALGILVIGKGQLSKGVFWPLVFLSMLIYRHIVLSLIGVAIAISSGKPVSYGSDEKEMAQYISVSNSAIGIPFLIAAVFSCCVLFLVVLDREIRYQFLLASAIGGVIGYIGWLSYIGPVVMP